MKSFSNLPDFCRHIVEKYGTPSNASEDDKAREFRNVYLDELPPNLRTLREVAAYCGIHVNSIDSKKIPSNLRGYHDVFKENRNIYYRNGDTISGIENTILHEFREMIEPIFAEVCTDYTPLNDDITHLVANKFATAVLLPVDEFKARIYETGFDVVGLSRYYAKSCAQVLLRMGEVLDGSIFMFCGLYEHDPKRKEWILNYRSGSMNNDDQEANMYGSEALFPRKGKSVSSGSLVDMVIKSRKPHLVQRITVLESQDDEGLVEIARPLIVSGSLTKVATVTVLSQNASVLQPQIDRIKPVVIEGFHKHL